MTLQSDKTKSVNALEKQLQKKIQSKPIQQKDAIGITIDWFRDTFPKTFIRKNFLPLKIGILQDIFKHLPKDQSISKKMVRTALLRYTRCRYYHEAILNHAKRVDLEGNPISEVTGLHREHAKKYLALRLQRFHAKQKEQ